MANKKNIKEKKCTDFSEKIEKLCDLEKKSAKYRADLGIKILLMLEENKDRFSDLASLTEKIPSSLGVISESQKELEKQVNSFNLKLNRLEEKTSQLSMKAGKTDNNLHQAKLLSERIANKVEKLSEEFIDRFIKKPLLMDLGVIYNRIRDTCHSNTISTEILEQFRIILESYEVNIIEPEKNEAFNPREHQAIQKTETTLKAKDGCVSETYSVGFKLKDRVIKHARVAIFSLNKNQCNERSLS